MVDHYEPGTQNASLELEKERMDDCIQKYPKLADRHVDANGNPPTRTWFFPPHYHRRGNLKQLVELCQRGYGEIELHLHHGKIKPDDSKNLEKTIKQCIKEYKQFGIFGSKGGKTKYGFIHGDWALDNSRHGKFCGVNNEISILKKTGCYADFTFPCSNSSTPIQINSIFYATDDPDQPKSHNKGVRVKKNGQVDGDLMIIQGPIHPFFFSKNITSLRAPTDEICGTPPVTAKRIDCWIKTAIHIKGKSNWIIVKTHTHGATSGDAVYGSEMDKIFSHLESKYNDGEKYILHYVTARELYNIIKAVENGEDGADPHQYRDYLIEKPLYDSSPEIYSASGKLNELVGKTYQ